jgi:predicted oxidoreductase
LVPAQRAHHRREFALSGSEQNPDLTERSIKLVLGRIGKGAPDPVRRFMERGVDFVVRKTLPELVAGMNQIGGNPDRCGGA